MKKKEERSLRDEVFAYVREKYGSEIETPWPRYPRYAVFRHGDNQKWYGLVMAIPRSRLGIPDETVVDVLNVKLGDPLLLDLLLRREGFYPGYHIRRGSWLSVVLDGTVPPEEIFPLIDQSFQVTASARTRQETRPPKEWIIPSNPRYYDIVHGFDDTDEIVWKQGKGIKTGDTVFLYVGQPVSAILYQCLVVETEIPYSFRNGNVSITKLMRIRLVRRYGPERFPFERLKRDYRIFAVRGPRGIPESLSEDLKLESERSPVGLPLSGGPDGDQRERDSLPAGGTG